MTSPLYSGGEEANEEEKGSNRGEDMTTKNSHFLKMKIWQTHKDCKIMKKVFDQFDDGSILQIWWLEMNLQIHSTLIRYTFVGHRTGQSG